MSYVPLAILSAQPNRVTGMGPIGLPELIVILVVALLVLGPKRLPEVARSLGKGLAEFRKAARDVETQVRTAIAEAEKESEKAEAAGSAPKGTPRMGSEPATQSKPLEEKKPEATRGGGGG